VSTTSGLATFLSSSASPVLLDLLETSFLGKRRCTHPCSLFLKYATHTNRLGTLVTVLIYRLTHMTLAGKASTDFLLV
jgi:hypothetical protein